MKKLILFSLICLASIAARAQESGIKGTWTGKLNVFGNELTLVFHFDGEDCTLDSPDQGIKGVPAKLERTETGIKVAVPSINAIYEGVNSRAHDRPVRRRPQGRGNAAQIRGTGQISRL